MSGVCPAALPPAPELALTGVPGSLRLMRPAVLAGDWIPEVALVWWGDAELSNLLSISRVR